MPDFFPSRGDPRSARLGALSGFQTGINQPCWHLDAITVIGIAASIAKVNMLFHLMISDIGTD